MLLSLGVCMEQGGRDNIDIVRKVNTRTPISNKEV